MNDERAVCDALIDDDLAHSDMAESNVKVEVFGIIWNPATYVSRQACECGTYLLLLLSLIAFSCSFRIQLCPC
jgi:hypothetical protein